MNFFTPKQIARRAVLASDALYRRAESHSASRSQTTRLLHLLLLLAVVYQVISSELIVRPLPGEPPSALFLLHEYIGMASFALVCAFWIWTFVRHGEVSLGKLFPWFSQRRIVAVAHDIFDQIQAVRRGDFFREGNGAFASAIHGMGLFIVTAMATTGTVLFFSGGLISHYAMSLHRIIANLMWAYLIAHASLGVLHHLLGSDVLRRMFWIKRGLTITTKRPSNTVELPDILSQIHWK